MSETFIKGGDWSNKNEFNLTERTKIRLVFRKNDTDAINPTNITKLEIVKNIEIISKNGDEQSSNIVMVKPLCCLKDSKDNVVAQDYIDYTRGIVHRECLYKVLNGSEDWILATTNSSGINRFKLNDSTIKAGVNSIVSNIKSDKLKATTVEQNYACVQGISGITTSGIYIYIEACKNMTVEQFKTWLSSNPITAVCELATPTTEPLNCSNKIVQYSTQTTVLNRDGAKIEVSLTNNEAISGVNGELGGLRDDMNKVRESLKRTLLWENGNYGGLVETNIELSSNDYDELEVHFRASTLYAVGDKVEKVKKGSNIQLSSNMYNPDHNVMVALSRLIKRNNDTSYTVENAHYTNLNSAMQSGFETRFCIPLRIYGIKH